MAQDTDNQTLDPETTGQQAVEEEAQPSLERDDVIRDFGDDVVDQLTGKPAQAREEEAAPEEPEEQEEPEEATPLPDADSEVLRSKYGDRFVQELDPTTQKRIAQAISAVREKDKEQLSALTERAKEADAFRAWFQQHPELVAQAVGRKAEAEPQRQPAPDRDREVPLAFPEPPDSIARGVATPAQLAAYLKQVGQYDAMVRAQHHQEIQALRAELNAPRPSDMRDHERRIDEALAARGFTNARKWAGAIQKRAALLAVDPSNYDGTEKAEADLYESIFWGIPEARQEAIKAMTSTKETAETTRKTNAKGAILPKANRPTRAGAGLDTYTKLGEQSAQGFDVARKAVDADPEWGEFDPTQRQGRQLGAK